MLRTLWFFVVLLTSTVWYGTGVLVAGLLGVPRRDGGVYDRAAKRWARNALWAARIPYRVVGLDRVPLGRPLVIASNHQSWFDIFLLAAVLPGSLRFVAKKELARIPLLGRAMRQSGHVFIDRQHRQAAFGAYEEAADAIRAGISAVVFPEGTRSRTGELLPFKKGPFVLAIAARVPLVPAYCAGTFTLLPKGSVRIRPHPIALTFGAPIDTARMVYDDRERLMEETRRAIEALRVDALRMLG
ncbi:MAG: 1-acyl-sn-glycerol-3-phosphate acyltransferase [Gemmatimonadetes bacterium]|nr:1-acyl-sn-glycerol-3-phosphate acyltransferase [Gemmatimonadota bacterium]MBI2403302.1 1-acyl-sn-glycerol-3-phosphate acyltransferase [Gemmatimonadota bacterium]